jgi:uncharacterized cupredoxin-like copper-binding protein
VSTTTNHGRLRTGLLIGASSLILGIGTTAAMAGAGSGPGFGPVPAQPAACAPPALAGAVVDVTASDMGGMMGPGMMGPHGPQPNGPGMGMGMMRLTATPASVPAGQVSLRVTNNGMLAHEVMVMPLGPGQNPGQRPVGDNGEVDETGSLGEAAQTCGAGEGDGIAPGTMGWTTLTLTPGRYELFCNIAGHYGSGMYTELDVTAAR